MFSGGATLFKPKYVNHFDVEFLGSGSRNSSVMQDLCMLNTMAAKGIGTQGIYSICCCANNFQIYFCYQHIWYSIGCKVGPKYFGKQLSQIQLFVMFVSTALKVLEINKSFSSLSWTSSGTSTLAANTDTTGLHPKCFISILNFIQISLSAFPLDYVTINHHWFM